MAVGVNIKKRRVELGLSQQELADAMGYKTRSTIAKIESGENDVSQSKLRKFAAVLRTTPEALIADGGPIQEGMSLLPDLEQLRHNKHIAVILAGGETGKNQQNIPSQFINVHGKPIVVYCMEVYQAHPAVDDIYIVCLAGWERIVNAYAKQYGITKLKGIVPGGSSGMASLKNAVDAVKNRYTGEDTLIIQESTRPLVSVETISKLLRACSEKGSATICHSMKEYVQFCVGGSRAEYVDRNAMIALQSPEAHKLSLITQVFENTEGAGPVDESCFTMMLYNQGYDVNFVEGGMNNIKIAREEDVATFGALIRKML